MKIKKIFNTKNHPNMIYVFQWDNRTMKTTYINPFNLQDKGQKIKTTKGVSLNVFKQFVKETVSELGLIGPWDLRSSVARCAPKII